MIISWMTVAFEYNKASCHLRIVIMKKTCFSIIILTIYIKYKSENLIKEQNEKNYALIMKFLDIYAFVKKLAKMYNSEL